MWSRKRADECPKKKIKRKPQLKQSDVTRHGTEPHVNAW